MSKWLSSVGPMFGTLPLVVQALDMSMLRREMRDGMYRPVSFILAQSALEIPLILFTSLAACVPAFLIGGWPLAAFGKYLLASASGTLAFEALAQLLSMDHVVVGLLVFMKVWLVALLYEGFFTPPEDIIWPLRILHYALPLRWQTEALAHTLFTSGADWDGAVLCSSCDSGFMCPGRAGVGCFGVTGTQVLESISVNYSVFHSDDRYGMCIGFIMASVVLLKLGYFLRLTHFVREGVPLHDSSCSKELHEAS